MQFFLKYTLKAYKHWEKKHQNEDLNLHGRNALAVVSIFGTDAEKALVKEIVENADLDASGISFANQQIRDQIANKYWNKMCKTWDHFDNVLGKAVN